jgi:paraquat-inducible protein B
MIELVMDDKTPAVYRGTGKYPEIPTIYSPFAKISKDLEEVSLQDAIARFGNLIDNIDDNIPVILENLNKMTSSLSDSTPETMKNMNAFIEDLNKSLPALLRNMNNVAAKIDSTIDKKNGEVSKTMENVNNALEEFTKAGRSMKNLTDYLERHPEAVIQGKEK